MPHSTKTKEPFIVFSGSENNPFNKEPSLASIIAKRNNKILDGDIKNREAKETRTEQLLRTMPILAEGQERNGWTVLTRYRKSNGDYLVMCNKCGDVEHRNRRGLEYFHACSMIPKKPPVAPVVAPVSAGDRSGTLTASYELKPGVWSESPRV